MCRRVVEGDSHPDQIDADGVIHDRGLVVRDAEDHGPGLGNVESGRVAGSIAGWAQDVELSEVFVRPRNCDKVCKDCHCGDSACREGGYQELMKTPDVLPT